MDNQCPELRETLLIWALCAADTAAAFVTYARVSPEDLYHVSHRGLLGGASRALVVSNFPFSLVAIALDGFAVSRLLSMPALDERQLRVVRSCAALAAVLCAVTAAPGVVDQAKLDARPVNALPALGVATTAALTVAAVRTRGVGPKIPWSRRDSVSLAAIGGLAALALPWILAEIGVYAGDIPGLNRVVLSKEFSSPGERLRSVHLGHHHGLDGTLLAVSALWLGRGLEQVPRGRLHTALSWYLSLMLSYGVANALNDAWHEQLEKRHITAVRFPSMLRPRLTRSWGLLLTGVLGARRTVFG